MAEFKLKEMHVLHRAPACALEDAVRASDGLCTAVVAVVTIAHCSMAWKNCLLIH